MSAPAAPLTPAPGAVEAARPPQPPQGESALARARRLGHRVPLPVQPPPPGGGTGQEEILRRTHLELPNLVRWDGPPWHVDTAKRDGGQEHLAGWIAAAKEATRLDALRSLIRQLRPESSKVDSTAFNRAVHAHDDLRKRIRVEGAQYLAAEADFATEVPPATTVIMRAINTGDMYQVRASLAIHPGYSLLIWGVAPENRGQAQQAASLVNDDQRVYYTERPAPPSGYSKTETWTTKDIGRYVSAHVMGRGELASLSAGDAEGLARILGMSMIEQLTIRGSDPARREQLLKAELIKVRKEGNRDLADRSQEYFRQRRMRSLAKGFAPYSEEEGRAFEQDLRNHHFTDDRRYVIVNFRGTGHSGRPGANAPALDTGVKGVRQLIAAVRETLGEVTVVPMGEEPKEMDDGPNLLNYWTWDSTRGSRARQTALLRYLAEHYDMVGAVGMRSGVMDQIAIAGIKIISIDISPHKGLRSGKLPNLATSKGWSRGLKLEDSYRESYGHAFIQDERADELTKPLDDWQGAFSEADLGSLKQSIAFYLGGEATPEHYRDRSHPLDPERMEEGVEGLVHVLAEPSTEVSAYDLVNHVHPYLAEMNSLTRGKPQNALWKAMLGAVDEILESLAKEHPKSALWMRDNQKGALLAGDTGERWYGEQRASIAQAFGMMDTPDLAVQSYRALDQLYRQALDMRSVILPYLEAQVREITERILEEQRLLLQAVQGVVEAVAEILEILDAL